jgi:hypothetical protein
MVDGYVTQVRNISPPFMDKGLNGIYTAGFRVRDGVKTLTPVYNQAGVETTTSYRSNLSLSDVDTKEEFFQLHFGSFRDNSPHDKGHTFSSVKDFASSSRYFALSPKVDMFWSNQYGQQGFSGFPLAGAAAFNALALPTLPSFDVNFWGNRAIARSAPTAPRANTLQTAAELIREGISLPGAAFAQALASRTGLLRSVGSEYLNIEFGWKPLISDLQAILKSVVSSSQQFGNLKSRSGMFTRRRRVLKDEVTHTPDGNVSASLNANGDFISQRMMGTSNSTTTQFLPASMFRELHDKVWFSGSFTYFLAPDEGLISRMRRYEQLANQLLGLRLTPAVLWELTPWSWLVDWFVDVQSALQAATLLSSDGLVLRYGYLMRTSVQRKTLYMPVRLPNGVTVIFGRRSEVISKARYRATPFGFGLNPNSFTARQWAILGALALSKSPNSLY